MRSGWGPPPRRRPPWWPDGEAFPPARRWGRGGPPAFARRIGCFFVAILAVTGLLGAVAGGLLARFGLLPVATLAALFAIAWVAIAAGGMRRMTRPMESIIEAAHRIEAGDYSAQVAERGTPDLRSVARAFNSMSARLKASDEQRRSFLADVTHELRTPLSVIRGQAEAIADGLYEGDAAHLAPILDATQTLDRLVEDLRTMVLTDAGNLVLHKEPTDLAALAADAVDAFKTQAESAGVTLSSDLADNLLTVEVDPARIRGVLGNLLSNAIRHTPSGGSVKVTVTAIGDAVDVTVTDTGEGISPELLPRVFERFVKGASSNGSGLGLAIAHDIVAAHGGRLEIESELGSGTRVRIALPIPRPPES
ncbi:MAG TPA: HAMP domain-containing sensor histidine kinase [Candidatus Dormibacteraeota bacterium]|nr:HAMP domain-containing sensor histidine kinase [Candidatus Dormibacteraeota bacterium]